MYDVVQEALKLATNERYLMSRINYHPTISIYCIELGPATRYVCNCMYYAQRLELKLYFGGNCALENLSIIFCFVFVFFCFLFSGFIVQDFLS